eukprot:CAMPEP_0182420674 /NCGR_PEP_ID=MMETSP1167-20130531/5644_1 /TAXON_ID=2988 /ORGANISM="Mallomonas Sp, Strain CCMP3275" /LENGTH=760 /DNA_ID=CAMNT_0024596939 /DNA_START=242 /DNA_END=2524 /DNA_ORIENTATION=+
MNQAAVPAFTLNVGNQIIKGLVTIGKFDGKSPSLACATSGGKILLHSPHEGSGNGLDGIVPSIRFLNLNRKISAISSGSLLPDRSNTNPEMLFVGTQSNLLAYDVERNSDVYFRDVQDGVNSLITGRISNVPSPVVVAGGNCSILGYNKDGMEMFWTVTGDNVSSLALADIDGDGANELVVGSDDFEIRFYKNENLINELTEADKVSLLASLYQRKFSYGLANGTVGVYENTSKRAWRVKTKNKVTSMAAYDIDADGVPEVVTGWNNGVVNARNSSTGEVVFKDTMNSAVAALVTADYRLDGKIEVIACSDSGEIKGYLPNTEPQVSGPGSEPIPLDTANDLKAIAQLQARKQDVINEMRQLEKSLKNVKVGEVIPGALPPGTSLSCSLVPDQEAGYVTMLVSANTEVMVTNLVAIDLEGAVLSGLEVVAVSPLGNSKTVVLPLHPVRNIPCSIRIQAHLTVRGYPTSLHVMEADVLLPRFAAFLQLMEGTALSTPSSLVSFSIYESTDKLHDWMQNAFVLNQPVKYSRDRLKAAFLAVCGARKKDSITDGAVINGGILEGENIVFNVTAADGANNKGGRLNVQIRCDSMDVAGDLIQDIARFMNITELESTANFPNEAAQFELILSKVEDFNAARVRLTADMAEDSQRVKALVVRAEDARLMGDMESMRRAYTELFALNNNLVGGYNLRSGNHEGLLEALKEVNQMIQRAANLRIGNAKTRVISECRAAVKKNNMSALLRIINNGSQDNSNGKQGLTRK